jgi:hypothetical protein
MLSEQIRVPGLREIEDVDGQKQSRRTRVRYQATDARALWRVERSLCRLGSGVTQPQRKSALGD